MNKLTNYKPIALIMSILTIFYGIYLRLFVENQDWFQHSIEIITSVIILCFLISCMFTSMFLFMRFCASIISNMFDFFNKIDTKLKRNQTGLSYNEKQKIYAEFHENILRRQRANEKGKKAHQIFEDLITKNKQL